MPSVALIVSWLAYAFIFIGYYRLQKKQRDGWPWTALGSLCLIIFGLSTPDALGIAVGNTAFVIVSIFGYFNWKAST